MGKLQMWLMAGVAMVALTGCGHATVTAPATFKASTKATAKVAAPAAKQPSVSAPKATTPSTKATPAPAKTPAPAAAADTGSIALTLNVTGNATVASLALKVYEQADPDMAADVPLTLSNGKAVFSQEDVPPGRYTFQVKALGADGAVLGQGSTEAIVSAGKPSEVSLELRVNTADSTSSVAGDETEETDESTDTSDTSAPVGGVIGLNVEII